MAYKISFVLNNVTIDTTNPVSVPNDSQKTIKFTASDGYVLDSLSYKFSDGSGANIPMDSGLTTFSYKFSVFDNMIITCTTIAKVIPKAKVKIRLNLENVSIDLPLGETSELEVGTYSATITALSGYELKNVGYVRAMNKTAFSYIEDENDRVTISPTNKTSVTFSFVVSDTHARYDIEYSASLITNVVGKFNNLYSVNDTILDSLNKERFLNSFDSGVYITNLLRLPFKLPDTIISESDFIILGDRVAETKAPVLLDNKVTYDLGDITIVGKYQNAYDYDNVDIRLFLPYSKSVTLETSKVMDKTIHIEYVINLFTGETTLNVTCDGELIITDNFDIGYQIPYIQSSVSSVAIKGKFEISNEIKNAYVIITRNKHIETESYDTYEKGIIKDYTGYIEMTDCDVKNIGTLSEIEKIKDELRKGVYLS